MDEASSEDDHVPFVGPSSFFSHLSTLSEKKSQNKGGPQVGQPISRDFDYYDPFMNQMVATNHDRIPPSRLQEAEEIPDDEADKEHKFADIESKIEEAKIRKISEQVYPDGLKSLFLCHKFALISQYVPFINTSELIIIRYFVQNENVMVMDEVYRTFEELLKGHMRKLFRQVMFVSQARYSVLKGNAEPQRHLIDEDVVNAALSIMPFPGQKDFVSENYADALYKVLDLNRQVTASESDLEVDTNNFSPFGSTELDSDYSL